MFAVGRKSTIAYLYPIRLPGKRIQKTGSRSRKIVGVARHDDEPMNESDCGDIALLTLPRVEIGVLAHIGHACQYIDHSSAARPLQSGFQDLAVLHLSAAAIGSSALLQGQRHLFIDIAHARRARSSESEKRLTNSNRTTASSTVKDTCTSVESFTLIILPEDARWLGSGLLESCRMNGLMTERSWPPCDQRMLHQAVLGTSHPVAASHYFHRLMPPNPAGIYSMA